MYETFYSIAKVQGKRKREIAARYVLNNPRLQRRLPTLSRYALSLLEKGR